MTTVGFRTLRARVEHRCDYCASAIAAGSTYHRWCWVDEGDASTVKAHRGCAEVADHYYAVKAVHDDEHWVQLEPLQEAVREDPDAVRAILLTFTEEERGWCWGALKSAHRTESV